MNFEFNKVAGAVLGTALGVMAVGIVADMIYAPPHHEKPGYVIAVAEPGTEGPEGPATPEVAPIADRLQTANAEQGAEDAGKCKTCHVFGNGEPARSTGPNLWGVVGANAVHGDFDFSDAMRAKGAEGMTWTFENLDHFIENPKGFIPGTAMGYAGVKNPEERADIIAYLRTLSDSPVPLPPPTPAPVAEAPAAPAGTETPPATTGTPPATEAPPAEAPAAPAPTEQSAEPPADAAPAGHSDGAQAPPAPTEAAPAESGGASAGDSGGAAPAPSQADPPAEAASPDGAPEPEAPATEAPAQ